MCSLPETAHIWQCPDLMILEKPSKIRIRKTRPPHGATMSTRLKCKSLSSMQDLTPDELTLVLDTAAAMKKSPQNYSQKFANKTLAMIFQKPSLRTRVSFEAGMTQMGGHAIYLSPNDIS